MAAGHRQTVKVPPSSRLCANPWSWRTTSFKFKLCTHKLNIFVAVFDVRKQRRPFRERTRKPGTVLDGSLAISTIFKSHMEAVNHATGSPSIGSAAARLCSKALSVRGCFAFQLMRSGHQADLPQMADKCVCSHIPVFIHDADTGSRCASR